MERYTLESAAIEIPVIAVDIGGTHTRIGSFATPASPAFTLRTRYRTPTSYAEQLERIAEHVPPCSALGVSFGGQLMPSGAAVHTAPNLPDYEGQPLAHDLALRCGCPVRLAHDPVCGLLAERRFGALLGEDRCAYLTLSTGTGCAIYLQPPNQADTQPVTTALTVSIQLGHQVLDGNTIPCLCGQIGCLETFTGGRQLTLRHGLPPEQVSDPAFWETLSAKLALGLLNLAQLTRIVTVAISGGIALNHPTIIAMTQAHIDAQIRGARLTLVPATLGEDAPLIGAALLHVQPMGAIIH